MKPDKKSLDEVFEELGFSKNPPLISKRALPIRATHKAPEIKQCGKQTFATEGQVKAAITSRMSKGTGTSNKLLPYWCNQCHGYHMTSREPMGPKERPTR